MNDIHPNHLVIKQLRVGTHTKADQNIILEDVNLAIPRGKTLALVGESGSGKSLTALSVMQLLPTGIVYGEGSQIQLDNLEILDKSEQAMQSIRGKKIGFIFQEPMTALNPVLTIEQQLAEVLYWHNLIQGKSKKQVHQLLAALLASLDIQDPERCLQDYPHQLSGGMKQRVMIAMALVGEPELLIADEPTTAVDIKVQAQILALLKNIQQQRGLSMLFITHDLGVVKQIADQVAVMYHGQIVEYADVGPFFAAPQHPYSQQLFAAIPAYSKRDYLLPVTNNQPDSLLQNGCHFLSRCPWPLLLCAEAPPSLMLRDNDHSVRCYLNKSPQFSPQAISAKTPTDSIAVAPLLSVTHLRVYFPVKKSLFKGVTEVVKAVDDISFDLYTGETLAIVGESGSGKTTLAKALIGLLPITSGTVQCQNVNMQMIFQDPYSSLNPKMLIADILAEGLRARGDKIKDASNCEAVWHALDQVGLSKTIINRYPHEFSGGQRQRIAIARALILSPDILICDEPTSALDLSVQAQVLNLLKTLQQELQLSYLFITHNLSAVSYLADRVLVMKAGKLIEQGDIKTVLFSPQAAYTRSLFET